MIGYVTIGTNNLEKAKAYYDALLAELGGKRTFNSERMQGYGVKGQPGSLVVCKPYDEGKASHGNGEMVALTAPSRELVDKVHADALTAGARDEGAPGIRTGTFYGAYFRDPDGNKICIFTTGA